MTTEDGYYGYNSHTDVETLTDDNGDTKSTYGYTAYGSNDNSGFTGIDKPDTTDPTKIELDGHQTPPSPVAAEAFAECVCLRWTNCSARSTWRLLSLRQI
ncbi:hypothetical protein [Streptomyces sp. NPDC057375]|uniref:hypothetical protein n=1 Tax=Streptomyces sp. NPDC057375 TaxID=3346109 RepID=UPI0036406085